MLDRVDAIADRGADAGRAMGVRRDPHAEHVRLLDRGGDLGVGHLLRARIGVGREDAAGDAEFDHLRAVAAVLANA